jgi:hypothetical protein
MANVGLAWGWRVLSPRWRGLWDGDLPEELPLDYDAPNMNKVIILLTDGNNEWYDWPGPGDGACSQSPPQPFGGLPGKNNFDPDTKCNEFKNLYPGADYTAYGRLSEGRLGTTNFSTAQSVLDDRMLDMCETMKAQDIIMYTITFGGTPDAGTQQLYRDCATEEDMYYHAPTNSQLQQVFVTIADELTKLRIAE